MSYTVSTSKNRRDNKPSSKFSTKIKNASLAISLLSTLAMPFAAHATNGLRLIGVGPTSVGMGGGAVAKPQTSTSIYINPAGMNDTANMADLNFLIGLPNTTMDSSLAPAGNPSAVAVGGEDDLILLPNGSATFGFMENNKLTIGLGTFLTSGFQVEFPVSRLPAALTGNQYDTSGRYANFKMIPAVSYRVLDNLSIGVGLDVNYSFLNADLGTSLPGFPQTAGRGRFDPAFGIGGRIGIIYKPIDMLQLGVNYSTRQYYQEFKRYSDVLKESLDMPQEVNVGVALTPQEALLLTMDFRWINWSGVDLFGDSVLEGGLGWRDQYIFITGLQYDFYPNFKFPAKLRLGYNYGRSPIPAESAFTNLLIPTIMEHHLSAGASLEINKHLGIDVAYTHEFKNRITDDGSLNPFGTGAYVEASANVFAFGLRGHWGRGGEKE
ncbi:MAG: outer membrane protein transport protein [Deltaproteobacteria bacterium]|nr:outer membrane protein transport protein [Deltaproteobacteria bacterium]